MFQSEQIQQFLCCLFLAFFVVVVVLLTLAYLSLQKNVTFARRAFIPDTA
eukprot:m.123308 g.123308  ORF g.123308 m.123308 type:complete len:50 (+) comp16585_c5_seq3:1455-1604(+)